MPLLGGDASERRQKSSLHWMYYNIKNGWRVTMEYSAASEMDRERHFPVLMKDIWKIFNNGFCGPGVNSSREEFGIIISAEGGEDSSIAISKTLFRSK